MMENVFFEGPVLWAQIDANMHMRHSAYADFAAQTRLAMMESVGLKPGKLFQYKIGPVLFREELFYLREVGFNDRIKVTCEVIKSRADGSRWSIRHEVYRQDDVKAATIIADGSWIDTEKRKLAILTKEISDLFAHTPKSADYIEEAPKS
jgi:acyl-CoA thioester hydrolase